MTAAVVEGPWLLPCPLCGDAVAWCGTHDPSDLHECHHIICKRCGDFDLRAGHDCETIADTQAEVAAAWNKRPAPPSARETGR